MGGSDATTQFAGNGNVFYFDYHKYIADGKTFGISESDKGNETYMLRLGNNGGSGTASVCDGNKTSASFSHQRGEIKINGNIWSAKSEDSSLISENSQCEILRIEGVTAIVRNLNKSE